MYRDSVVPLYIRHVDTKKYSSIGSAVLIECRHRRFLITAAHVIESMQGHRTYIFFEHTFYEFRGLSTFLSDYTLYGSRANDPIDLAVIPLPLKLEIQSANALFITYQMCIRSEEIASSLYQAIGYPHAKNSKAMNHTMRVPGKFMSEGLRYTVHDVNNRAFPYKFFCSEYHIATCLTKDGRLQGEISKSPLPDLRGMSGGLLQKVDRYNIASDNFSVAYPSGIILEKSKDGKVFFSLKLLAVFEWINIHWEYIQTHPSSSTR